MNSLKQMRYKDDSPKNTVKRLKEILKNNGIEVEEHWEKKSSVGTYSLRLCVKGTNMGQNGKGMTKDFAAASAYAEFFERYQNGILVFRTEKPTEDLPFSYAADEKKMTVEELIKEKNEFLNKIVKDNDIEDGKEEKFLEELLGEKNNIITVPYYSVKEKRIVNLPNVLACHVYCTNGMCAGNTPEEAMIEGISEILERYVSTRIFFDKPSLPEIPKLYLANFPRVEEMFEKLKSNRDFVCKLIDCSFGGKYPVAGLMIIQKNTGRFGFKLGAHPDYGIAMERCFTEAAQGMDIYEYAQSCLFDFKDENIEKDENVREFLYSNIATLPYQLLSKNKTYSFTKIADVSNLNNKQILKKLTNQILGEGYDILIRDVSTLEFPSFRIIIPGMTEYTHAPMAGRFNMFEKLEYLLKDLHRIDLNNITEVISLLETQINDIGYESLYTFMNVKDLSKLPYENIGMGLKYFLAMCYVMNKQYKKAEETLENIIFISENLRINQEQYIFLKAVYYYVSAINKLQKHEDAIYYLTILFEQNIVERIEEIFENKENILIKHYNIKEEDYVENDDAYYLPYMKKLRKMQKENIIDQNRNAKLFQ